ncbi:MAG: HsdR family type I site-specific deoxyribonuclease [Opitutales bacterium]|nr:HsdR family type I site-specific deoxyribonuclease [Opitutales bacterium]
MDKNSSERDTQRRVIKLFTDPQDPDCLGYRFLGNWIHREGNGPIQEGMLEDYLRGAGYELAQTTRAIDVLRREASHSTRSLYENNKAVYERMRYGISVKTEAGRKNETIQLINWEDPEANDWALAEEVTLRGNLARRPDLVLYLNGLAVGVIELKSSRVSISDGIRQLLSNQQPDFHQSFFTTVQFVFAGNDAEGLRYGTVGTPEKFFLQWKEEEEDNSRFKLDKYLIKMCRKDRLLELIRDFILFDGGIKKVPRFHQYFGVKAAQQHVERGEGGIIWHTQGSGKSIVMVLLAKWILANKPHARVVVITDRDELDRQIEQVFGDSGEDIYRTSSGQDLLTQLGQATPRLLCSLVHKFGRQKVADFDAFIRDLETSPSHTVGDIYVFVDECHRTQSGKLHRAMSALIPEGTFIGFTGTPLLKKDKATSLEVFGRYIHTYKFSEAVEDEVVLDLIYEARDIDQELTSQKRVDAWFEAKTAGLNDWQKDELKRHWGTLQKVLSSRSRMERVVADIVFDFSTKPRLANSRGNAMLVASSIYEACQYFSLFQKTPLRDRCGVVTSYDPQASDITKEETGAHTETAKQAIYKIYQDLLETIEPKPGMSRTGTYEEEAKRKFIKEPASMRLLVVVDKLLTGFDAPPCTYLYIDKTMQDHGLFQAICRTNRIDGEDKDFGYIVDYKDLFRKVEDAIAVYSSELDHSSGGADPQVLMQDRLKKGRERLETARESLAILCEDVESPGGDLEYIHYFCGNTEVPSDLEEREPLRSAFYKGIAGYLRGYASIADKLPEAGFSEKEVATIQEELDFYAKKRDTIRLASGETLDLKPYEADMRYLLDTYIAAEEPRVISDLDNYGLVDLIVKTGIADALAEKKLNQKPQRAVAETIENNVRKKIIKERLNDPAYFGRMSELLDEIIAQRRAEALSYEEYLRKIEELAKKVSTGHGDETPSELDTPGKRAIYNNLQRPAEGQAAEDAGTYQGEDPRVAQTKRLHEALLQNSPADWRGISTRETVVKEILYQELQDIDEVERLFAIIKQQSEY